MKRGHRIAACSVAQRTSSRRPAVLRVILLMLVSALMNDSSKAHATVFCENINGNKTIVGEARHYKFPPDICYANIYWDAGDELSLDTGKTMGGASTSATNLGFFVMTHTRDPFTDVCTNVTYELVQKRSNSISGNCPSGYTSFTDTLVVNTCEFGVDDRYYVSKRFGRDQLPFNYFWQWDLSVEASGCSSSDTGCGQVSSTCTRSEY